MRYVGASKGGVLGAVGHYCETYLNGGESLGQGFGIDVAAGIDEAVLHGPEGDGAVHRAGVDVAVAYSSCKRFGHCAFAGGGEAVEGYYDFLVGVHIVS